MYGLGVKLQCWLYITIECGNTVNGIRMSPFSITLQYPRMLSRAEDYFTRKYIIFIPIVNIRFKLHKNKNECNILFKTHTATYK